MSLFDVFKRKKSPPVVAPPRQSPADSPAPPGADTPERIMKDFAAEVLTWPKEQAAIAAFMSREFVEGKTDTLDKFSGRLTVRQFLFVGEHCKRIEREMRARAGVPPEDETQGDDIDDTHVEEEESRPPFSDPLSKQLLGTFVESVVEDRMRYEATGERPETRLIPHIRIKLDIMVKAYESDMKDSIAAVQNENLSEANKQAEVKRIQSEVGTLIYRLKREPSKSIEANFEHMKKGRTDLRKFEKEVRAEKVLWNYDQIDGLKEYVT